MAQCCSKPQLQGHLKTQEFSNEVFYLGFFFLHKTNENQLKQKNTLNQQQRAQISYP